MLATRVMIETVKGVNRLHLVRLVFCDEQLEKRFPRPDERSRPEQDGDNENTSL